MARPGIRPSTRSKPKADGGSKIDAIIAPVLVRVECHVGYKGEEYPQVVHLEGQRWEVTELLGRWRQGAADPTCTEAEYFKIRTAQGELILKHDSALHAWFLMCEF